MAQADPPSISGNPAHGHQRQVPPQLGCSLALGSHGVSHLQGDSLIQSSALQASSGSHDCTTVDGLTYQQHVPQTFLAPQAQQTYIMQTGQQMQPQQWLQSAPVQYIAAQQLQPQQQQQYQLVSGPGGTTELVPVMQVPFGTSWPNAAGTWPASYPEQLQAAAPDAASISAEPPTTEVLYSAPQQYTGQPVFHNSQVYNAQPQAYNGLQVYGGHQVYNTSQQSGMMLYAADGTAAMAGGAAVANINELGKTPDGQTPLYTIQPGPPGMAPQLVQVVLPGDRSTIATVPHVRAPAAVALDGKLKVVAAGGVARRGADPLAAGPRSGSALSNHMLSRSGLSSQPSQHISDMSIVLHVPNAPQQPQQQYGNQAVYQLQHSGGGQLELAPAPQYMQGGGRGQGGGSGSSSLVNTGQDNTPSARDVEGSWHGNRGLHAGAFEGLGSASFNTGAAMKAIRMGHAHANTSSTYLGVTWYKASKRWQARLCCDNKKFHLGYYATEIDAARAYDRAVLEHKGPNAPRNFADSYLGGEDGGGGLGGPHRKSVVLGPIQLIKNALAASNGGVIMDEKNRGSEALLMLTGGRMNSGGDHSPGGSPGDGGAHARKRPRVDSATDMLKRLDGGVYTNRGLASPSNGQDGTGSLTIMLPSQLADFSSRHSAQLDATASLDSLTGNLPVLPGRPQSQSGANELQGLPSQALSPSMVGGRSGAGALNGAQAALSPRSGSLMGYRDPQTQNDDAASVQRPAQLLKRQQQQQEADPHQQLLLLQQQNQQLQLLLLQQLEQHQQLQQQQQQQLHGQEQQRQHDIQLAQQQQGELRQQLLQKIQDLIKPLQQPLLPLPEPSQPQPKQPEQQQQGQPVQQQQQQQDSMQGQVQQQLQQGQPSGLSAEPQQQHQQQPSDHSAQTHATAPQHPAAAAAVTMPASPGHGTSAGQPPQAIDVAAVATSGGQLAPAVQQPTGACAGQISPAAQATAAQTPATGMDYSLPQPGSGHQARSMPPQQVATKEQATPQQDQTSPSQPYNPEQHAVPSQQPVPMEQQAAQQPQHTAGPAHNRANTQQAQLHTAWASIGEHGGLQDSAAHLQHPLDTGTMEPRNSSNTTGSADAAQAVKQERPDPAGSAGDIMYVDVPHAAQHMVHGSHMGYMNSPNHQVGHVNQMGYMDVPRPVEHAQYGSFPAASQHEAHMVHAAHMGQASGHQHGMGSSDQPSNSSLMYQWEGAGLNRGGNR